MCGRVYFDELFVRTVKYAAQGQRRGKDGDGVVGFIEKKRGFEIVQLPPTAAY